MTIMMPGSATERVCVKCEFYRPTDRPGHGECRHGSPHRRGWPRVSESDYCGRFLHAEVSNG